MISAAPPRPPLVDVSVVLEDMPLDVAVEVKHLQSQDPEFLRDAVLALVTRKLVRERLSRTLSR